MTVRIVQWGGVADRAGSADQTGFVVDDDLFDHLVFALAVVLRFEILSEDLRDALPESGDESTAELLEDLVGGVFGFAVDEFEQDAALGSCHVFQYGGVLLLDLVVHLLDIGFLGFFGWEAAEFVLHFGHFGACDLGDGVYLSHGIDQPAVTSQVDRSAEDVDGQDMDQSDGVAVFLDFPLLVPESATALGHHFGECGRDQEEEQEPLFHDRQWGISRQKNGRPGVKIASKGRFLRPICLSLPASHLRKYTTTSREKQILRVRNGSGCRERVVCE